MLRANLPQAPAVSQGEMYLVFLPTVWLETRPSFRYQDKFFGSVIQAECDRRQCLFCGVQCSENCTISCLGYQPEIYYTPFALSSSETKQVCVPRFLCSLLHRVQPTRTPFRDERCLRCCGKRFNDACSEHSGLDSDYSEGETSSSSCGGEDEAFDDRGRAS